MMFRTLSDLTTVRQLVSHSASALRRLIQRLRLTLIFPYVFQRKGQAGVPPLHYPDLSKGTLSHHTQQSKMVEVHCRGAHESVNGTTRSAYGGDG